MSKRVWITCCIVVTSFILVWSIASSLLASGGQQAVYTRVAISADPTRISRQPAISGAGDHVAFLSNSDLLNENVDFYYSQIWLYDTQTMTYTRVTTFTSGFETHYPPKVNGDGTKIVFTSNFDFLNDGNDSREVWLYDTTTMTYTQITTAPESHTFPFSAGATIDREGTKIAFYSNVDLLNDGLGGNQHQIWLYNTATMTYTRVTTSSDTDRRSVSPLINRDSTTILFSSNSDLLGENLGSSDYYLWLYDISTTAYTRLARISQYGNYTINTDGTIVAFESKYDLLNQGVAEDRTQIWLYDTNSLTYTRITTPTTANESSNYPSISGDGTQIAFVSGADFLDTSIVGAPDEVWLYDTTTLTYTRVTSSVTQPYNRNGFPMISEDGQRIVFEGGADLLDEGLNTNQVSQIWLWHAPGAFYLPMNYQVENGILTLNWTTGGLNNCQYDLYHSQSPFSGFSILNSDMSSMSAEIMLGALNPASSNYYYVHAHGCDGDQEASSQMVGVFDFELSID